MVSITLLTPMLTVLTHMTYPGLGFPDKPPRIDEIATSTKWFETTTRNESASSGASDSFIERSL